MDQQQPEIVRATAVSLLPNFFSSQSAQLLQIVSQSDEPLLGMALASSADSIPPQYRAAFAVPLLYDKHRVTRGLAAQSLVGVSLQQFPDKVHNKYQSGIEEYLSSLKQNLDRPESFVNLGIYYYRSNKPSLAIQSYQLALDAG